jgi:hypothetical protein
MLRGLKNLEMLGIAGYLSSTSLILTDPSKLPHSPTSVTSSTSLYTLVDTPFDPFIDPISLRLMLLLSTNLCLPNVKSLLNSLLFNGNCRDFSFLCPMFKENFFSAFFFTASFSFIPCNVDYLKGSIILDWLRLNKLIKCL